MIDHALNPGVDAGMSGTIIGTPIGTLDEIVAAGLNPELVACCHAPVDGQVRGCPVWASCQFNRRDMGGFKGQGPEYIGYYLKTSRADKAHQVENCMSCVNFTRTLQGRMNFGRAQRDAGKDHELIRIVAWQPKPGEKPTDRNIIYVSNWKRNAADGGNRTGDISMSQESGPMVIPIFPRPSDNPGITYDEKLRAREAARSEAESEDDEIRFNRMRMASAAMAGTLEEETTESGDDDTTLDMGTTPPLAAPVQKPGQV